MNIFTDYKIKLNAFFKNLENNKIIKLPKKFDNFSVEIPKIKAHGDFSTNAPMIFAKENNLNPIILANIIKKELEGKFSEIVKIEVAKPGFLNFFFNNHFWYNFLKSTDANFGKDQSSDSKKILIEYVSANPTGPLHVGHCRGAVFGDILANLLSFVGNKVVKEYYINDYGNQINQFVKSVYFRILEIKNNSLFPNDQDLYPGEYVVDIAKSILKKNKFSNFDNYDLIFNDLKNLCIEEAMNLIKNDLRKLGIVHDNFVSENYIVNQNLVEKALNILKEKNYVYEGVLEKPKGNEIDDWEPRKQILFQSTKFGDDTDRALKKSDGTWTYFANDVAYHLNKIERKFDLLINVLGADHAGYLKRQSSCVSALSENKQQIISKVCQLVKLFKSGNQLKMSKRAGDFITASDLISEVGKDSVRFMMIYRSNDSQLDFDFDLVTDHSKENPVFYVQYAHARICSLFRKNKYEINNEKTLNLDFLNQEIEIDIIKKIAEWPKCLELSAYHLEPHRVPFYLYELASLFHTYWNSGNENDNLKILNENQPELQTSRLFLIKKIQLVLKSGLDILNVTAPVEM
ncbi:ArgS Arginyl-tRNA synthetase [Candidatus Pelagibacterales bacterium]|jgi:arginyl-tRNA synthetase|nr:arginine--tRNA ligase [Candidatus Fonsibacter sp.]